MWGPLASKGSWFLGNSSPPGKHRISEYKSNCLVHSSSHSTFTKGVSTLSQDLHELQSVASSSVDFTEEAESKQVKNTSVNELQSKTKATSDINRIIRQNVTGRDKLSRRNVSVKKKKAEPRKSTSDL